MAVKPVTFGPFVKGVDASAGVVSQPKGTLPRSSNHLLTKRGALKTCDGSAILHQFGSGPVAGRGSILAVFYFAPTGVPAYYLILAYALDQHLGPPQNLTAADAGAVSPGLGAATYFYKVTALDGAGGETTGSIEVSLAVAAGHGITLTWNVVPNATGYNVYRSTSTGAEGLLTGTGLPVAQVPFGTLSVTVTDTGASSAPSALTLSSSTYVSPHFPPSAGKVWTFKTTTPHGLAVGSGYVIAGVTPSSPFNGSFTVSYVIDSFTVLSQLLNVIGTGQNLTGSGGTLTPATLLPGADTTQQIALYKCPLLPTPTTPTNYTNANIVALFPANPRAATSVGSFSGGGGGGGAGGGGGGGGTGGGGGGKGGFQ